MQNILIEKAKTAIASNHCEYLGLQENLGASDPLVIFSEGNDALTCYLPLKSFVFDGAVCFVLVQNELRVNRLKMRREFVEGLELVEA